MTIFTLNTHWLSQIFLWLFVITVRTQIKFLARVLTQCLGLDHRLRHSVYSCFKVITFLSFSICVWKLTLTLRLVFDSDILSEPAYIYCHIILCYVSGLFSPCVHARVHSCVWTSCLDRLKKQARRVQRVRKVRGRYLGHEALGDGHRVSVAFLEIVKEVPEVNKKEFRFKTEKSTNFLRYS